MKDNVTMILTRNPKTVEVVKEFCESRKLTSYARGLDDLIAEARQLGLHKRHVTQAVISAALRRIA